MYGTSYGSSKIERDILVYWGINIDSYENGVFLPTVKGVSRACYHPSLHTKDYYENVEKYLSRATSKEDVIDILYDIRVQLMNGTFPY